MSEEIKVQGLSELRQTLLRELPEALQGQALQTVLTQAAKPIIATARQLAPVDTGRLRRSIYSFRGKQSTPTRQVRKITVRSGKRFRKGNGDAFYWKFVEFGHRVRSSVKGKGAGGESAVVPARPFLRPAFEAKKLEALEIVKKNLLGIIEKVAAKASARSRSKFGASILNRIFG